MNKQCIVCGVPLVLGHNGISIDFEYTQDGEHHVEDRYICDECAGVIRSQNREVLNLAEISLRFEDTIECMYQGIEEMVSLFMLPDLMRVALGQVEHVYHGECPDEYDWTARDPECPACQIIAKFENGE